MFAPLIVTLPGVTFQLLMNDPRLFDFQHFVPAPSKLKGDVIVASGLHGIAPHDVPAHVGVAEAVATAVAVAVAVDRAVPVAVGGGVAVAVAVARAVVAVGV